MKARLKFTSGHVMEIQIKEPIDPLKIVLNHRSPRSFDPGSTLELGQNYKPAMFKHKGYGRNWEFPGLGQYDAEYEEQSSDDVKAAAKSARSAIERLQSFAAGCMHYTDSAPTPGERKHELEKITRLVHRARLILRDEFPFAKDRNDQRP